MTNLVAADFSAPRYIYVMFSPAPVFRNIWLVLTLKSLNNTFTVFPFISLCGIMS